MVRLKNRYVLCELIFSDDQRAAQASVSTYALQQAIQDAVHQIHGDFGLGAIAAGLMVKYVGAQTKTVLIKVRHRAVKYLTSALPFVKAVFKLPCFLLTLHVAGTIRACQKFLVGHNRRHLAILYKTGKTQAEKNAVLRTMKSCEAEETLWTESKDDSDNEEVGDVDSDDDT